MTANENLKNKVLEIAGDDGVWLPDVAGMKIARRHEITGLTKCFYDSMILYMVQGAKKTVLNDTEFTYRAGQCIVNSIAVPCASAVLEASPEQPMLCVALEIDSRIMAEMLMEVELPKIGKRQKNGMGVIEADEALADAFYRLLCLKDSPEPQKSVLSSFIVREIYYRLLISPIGYELRLANLSGTANNQIARAISWLKENFKETLNVEELAGRVNMSPTSFYRHFNEAVRITPVQYQKQLRLYEAQRLLLAEDISAESACYRVGYKSANQFNRDYKKMFGLPPKANVNQLKNA